MPVREIFDNLKLGLEPICEKRGVIFHLDIAQGELQTDYDLFKTMMLNLIDNAVKADSRDVWVTGRQWERNSTRGTGSDYGSFLYGGQVKVKEATWCRTGDGVGIQNCRNPQGDVAH